MSTHGKSAYDSTTPTESALLAETAAEKPQASRLGGIDLIAAVLLAACGHLLIKYGLTRVPVLDHPSIAARVFADLLTPQVILGLAVYGFGTLLWIAVVSKRDISYLYPFTAVNYVLITLGGMWLFGETVSARRWLGISVVMLGVAALQIFSGRQKR